MRGRIEWMKVAITMALLAGFALTTVGCGHTAAQAKLIDDFRKRASAMEGKLAYEAGDYPRAVEYLRPAAEDGRTGRVIALPRR